MKKNVYIDTIDMIALLEELTPLERSLANKDTDKALDIIKRYLPNSTIQQYATGSKAWTWTIPKRWELDSATIKSNGKKIVDSKNSILHVINYSIPFKGVVTHDELMRHIVTSKERPEAIPFHFSFYEPKWGFCIPESWMNRFTADSYEVQINSRFEDGNLQTLTYFLPGENRETFVICADICHPLQVNDSLSGLVVAIDIIKRLEAVKSRKYSYLLLVVPETIGSIAYLANNPDVIQNSIGAFFCEMLGTDGKLVGQRTRDGETYWDKLFETVLSESGFEYRIAEFNTSAGNDEKVLDSPGVDIPTFSLTRYPYPEYHTSDDNMSIISLTKLREGRDILQRVIDYAENDYIPVLKYPGPIFLSGNNLYPDWYSDPSLFPVWKSFIKVMYAIDGRRSVIEMAIDKGVPISSIVYWVMAFKDKGLSSTFPYILSRIERTRLMDSK
jgi:aminopeptidase-like protein